MGQETTRLDLRLPCITVAFRWLPVPLPWTAHKGSQGSDAGSLLWELETDPCTMFSEFSALLQMLTHLFLWLFDLVCLSRLNPSPLDLQDSTLCLIHSIHSKVMAQMGVWRFCEKNHDKAVEHK